MMSDNDNPTIYLPPYDVSHDRWLEWVMAQIEKKYMEMVMTGEHDHTPANINIAPSDYPKIGRYILLMSHGLPARHIEHFTFNRRGEK